MPTDKAASKAAPKPAPKAAPKAKPAPKAAVEAPVGSARPSAELMATMAPSELATLHGEFVRAGRLDDAAVIVEHTRRALAERGYSVQSLYDDIVSDGISAEIEDDAALLVACGAVEGGADAPATVEPPPAPTPTPVTTPAAQPEAQAPAKATSDVPPRCVRVTRTFQVLRFPPRDFPRRVGRCDIYHDEIAAWLWEHHRDKVVPFPPAEQ